MMELWLVRHGQTDWNKAHRIQGWLNVPLNYIGREQAQKLADALAGRTFSRIYSSDLGRARETAEILAKRLELPVHIDPLLRERRFGPLEGRVREADGRAAVVDTLTHRFPPIAPLPRDEESLQRLESRVQAFLAKVAAEANDVPQLAVSHGGFVRATIRCLGGNPPAQLDNTSVTRLRWGNGRWRLLEVNLATHLSGAEQLAAPESDRDPIL